MIKILRDDIRVEMLQRDGIRWTIMCALRAEYMFPIYDSLIFVIRIIQRKISSRALVVI